MAKPTTLDEAIRYFSDLDVATEYVASLRWPDGFVCPHCGGREYSYISTRRLWKCKSCQKQSSVKVGTMFADSALGLDKWLPAIWVVANSESGMSSHELARLLGTTQKSAWLMLQRIREAMVIEPTPPPPTPQPEARFDARLPDATLAEPETRRRWLLALALAFALGALVGRLSNRLGRR